MITLIKNADIYAPEHLGIQDILIVGGRIARIDRCIDDYHNQREVKVYDAKNAVLSPSFIDMHVHMLSPIASKANRSPEMTIDDFFRHGVTTAVGVLGSDYLMTTPSALLGKCRSLGAQGLNVYMYSGSYHHPPVTVTTSIPEDIAYIPEIIGVKVAIGDSRGSNTSGTQLAQLVSDTLSGATLGAKTAVVHIHTRNGENGLSPLHYVLDHTDLPIESMVPTHINHSEASLQNGIEYGLRGGHLDFTAGFTPMRLKRIGEYISRALDAGVGIKHITISSDSNCPIPAYDIDGSPLYHSGYISGKSLLHSVMNLVHFHGLPFSKAIQLITLNPAVLLGISDRKGVVRNGADADLVLYDHDMNIDKVFAAGRVQ